MSGLLPCPLCGSQAELIVLSTGQYHPTCKIKGGYCFLNKDFPDPETHGFKYKIDAIRAWNRRPDDNERSELHQSFTEEVFHGYQYYR